MIFSILLLSGIALESVKVAGGVVIANLVLGTIHGCLSSLDEGTVPEVLPTRARLLLAMRAHAQTFLSTLFP